MTENENKGTNNRIRKDLLIILSFAVLLIAVSFAVNCSAEACTAVYVGSRVSEDGTTVIARSADTHPNTVSVFLKITEASRKSNRTVTGYNGFKWDLPKSSYKFVSSPRPLAIEKGNAWDSMAVNECGLAVSATVSAYVNERALKADPYVETGITEDNIAGILAAACSNAREAAEYLGKIIDEEGSAESNIVLIADQNEAWYMEIYTGHQYAAVRMPEDAVAGFANEFSLGNLQEFGKNVVLSEELEALAKNNGFASYDGSYLNLFNTYVGSGRYGGVGNKRVWRAHSLLAPSSVGAYNENAKYPLFYKPDKKVTTEAVIDLFRDRYDGVVSEAEISKGSTRVIATENSSQVHVIKVHRDAPAQMACEVWFCDSNAAYAPFVPLTNNINDADEAYKYELKSYGIDENSAAHVFKKLNALAAQSRTHYGINIEKLWQEKELQWNKEYQQVYARSLELYEKGRDRQAEELMTNYSMAVQAEALDEARRITDELSWFMMETSDTMSAKPDYDSLKESGNTNPNEFMPTVGLKSYAGRYGWKLSSDAGKWVFTLDDKCIEVKPSNGKRTSKGTITVDGEQAGEELKLLIKEQNGDVFVPLNIAEKYFKSDLTAAVNFREYTVSRTLRLIFLIAVVLLLAVMLFIRNKGRRSM